MASWLVAKLPGGETTSKHTMCLKESSQVFSFFWEADPT